MSFDGAVAISLFVAAMLFSMAVTILARGRRTIEGLMLVVFLGLVSVNFLVGGLRYIRPAPPMSWSVPAALTNIWDPVLLVAFATLYPYRRRTAAAWFALGLVAALAVAATAAVILDPVAATGPYGRLRTDLEPWEAMIATACLAVAYTAAWVFVVRGARDAPTPSLQARASWAVLAVGVATVPRVGLVHADILLADLLAVRWAAAGPGWFAPYAEGVALVGLAIPLTVFVLLLGHWSVRRPPAGAPPHVRRALRGVGLACAVLLATAIIAVLVEVATGFNFGATAAYGLRWVAFAAILGYGVLAYDVVDFQGAAWRVLPVAGAMIAASAMFVVALLVLDDSAPETRFALSFALALGVAAPAGWLTRGVVGAITPLGRGGATTDGRLVLYQAALEAAWARGPPGGDGRRRLEQARRDFRLTADEARALEHAVAAAMTPKRQGLRRGEEIAPGLVVERVLGEGAQGRVWLARQLPTGDHVVVKELHDDVLGGRGARARLLGEARALQRLDHPHIVRLHEVRVYEGRHLLLMDYVAGRPLAEIARRGALPPARVRRWAEQLLLALEAAHAAGVVHRDIKPSNILIDAADRALLTDFGTARLEGDGDHVRATLTSLDARSDIVGTLQYMAPEQVQCGAVGPASDLYSLGLVLVELLSGRALLDLRGHGLYDAMERVARPEIDLSRLPASWRPVLTRALEPDRALRLASASEMRAALPPP